MNSIAAAAEEVDHSISALLREMEARTDNAMSSPPPSSTYNNSNSATVAVQQQQTGWVLKPSEDSPLVTWTQDGYQYTVQNPNNNGDLELKFELYRSGDLVHKSRVFLSTASDDSLSVEIYKRATDLGYYLEHFWVDRNTGVPRCGGLTQSMEKYRKCTSQSTEDCTTAAKRRRPATTQQNSSRKRSENSAH